MIKVTLKKIKNSFADQRNMEEKVKGPGSVCCLLMLNLFQPCQGIRLGVYPRLLCGRLFDFFLLCVAVVLYLLDAWCGLSVSLLWLGPQDSARDLLQQQQQQEASEREHRHTDAARVLCFPLNDLEMWLTAVFRRFLSEILSNLNQCLCCLFAWSLDVLTEEPLRLVCSSQNLAGPGYSASFESRKKVKLRSMKELRYGAAAGSRKITGSFVLSVDILCLGLWGRGSSLCLRFPPESRTLFCKRTGIMTSKWTSFCCDETSSWISVIWMFTVDFHCLSRNGSAELGDNVAALALFPPHVGESHFCHFSSSPNQSRCSPQVSCSRWLISESLLKHKMSGISVILDFAKDKCGQLHH